MPDVSTDDVAEDLEESAEQESPPEEPGDSEPNSFTINAPDTYRGGDKVRVVVRGFAESYDQYFVVAFQVSFHEERVEIEDLSALAGSERSLLERVDAEESYPKVTQEITTSVSRLSDSKRKDSKNFRNKFERIIRQPEQLEGLMEPLREDGEEDFEETLHDFLLGEMFPGTELRIGVRVLSVGETDYGETNGDRPSGNVETPETIVEDTDPEQSDSSPPMLDLRPEYDAFDGVSLESLRPGDKFDVRVVGDSLHDLQNKYLDGEDPGDADESKILNAELKEVRNAPSKSVKTFVVRLANDARGTFSADPSARVSFRTYDDLSASVKLKHRARFFLLTAMIFLFSVCLIFFLFPKPFLGVLK